MAGYIGSKASVVSSGAEHKKLFNITTTTTSLTGLVYTPTLVHVFHNGVRLVDGTDYTATNGTSITLTVAAENGDQVAVVSYATFQTSDTVSASAGGTFGNSVTMNSGAVVNRTGNGTIIDLQSGGTTVGSIGAKSGDIYIGTGDTGVRFNDTDKSLYPADTTTGGASDGNVSLGVSAARYKDLFLSGGVYLGGTGAANKLDDYEEGSIDNTNMTFTGSGSAVNNANYTTLRYTKVGSMVTVTGNIFLGSVTSQNGYLKIPLPFVNGTGEKHRTAGAVANPQNNIPTLVIIDAGTTYGRLISSQSFTVVSVSAGHTYVINLSYHTDE